MQSYKFLLTPVMGWMAAQCIKFFVRLKNGHKISSISIHLQRSGDMPSAHTAVMMSLSTLIGLEYGFDSAMFAIAITMAFIVAYDSTGVRRVVGDHSDAIHKIMSVVKLKNHIAYNARGHGHSVVEVLVGAILGIAVGFAVHYIL